MKKSLILSLLLLSSPSNVWASEVVESLESVQLPVPTRPRGGFFDKTLEDPEKNLTEKLLLAKNYVEERVPLYNYYVRQIKEAYVRRHLLADKETNAQIIRFWETFEDKKERVEAKEIHFGGRIEMSSEGQKNFSIEPIAKYNGKFFGDEDRQAEYALEKFNQYKWMNLFLEQYPVKASFSDPLLEKLISKSIRADLQSALKEDSNKVAEDNLLVVKRLYGEPTAQRIELLKTNFSNVNDNHTTRVLDSLRFLTLEEIVREQKTLKDFVKEHQKKWKKRLSEEYRKKKLRDAFALVKAREHEEERA